jgi:PAS domain S-box-containing protein
MESTNLSQLPATAVMEASPDGLVLCADTGTILFVNEAMVAMSGYDKAELIGQPIEVLVPTSARPSHPTLRSGFVKADASRPMGPAGDVRLLHRDGTELAVSIALSVLNNERGHSVVASVRDISERVKLERRLQTSNEALALVSERERIARDLHDTALQHLYALGLEMQALEMLVDPAMTSRVTSAVNQIDHAIREIRTTVFTLGSAQRQGSFGQEIQALIRQATRLLGFTPRLVIDGAAQLLIPAEVRLELFAVAREALGNVARHAHATEVLVEIRVEDKLTVTIDDNGVGIAPNALGRGNGLGNLAARASGLGGSFDIQAKPTGGTLVTWNVPL